MKRLVIVGAGGRLGAALAREYAREFDVVGFNHAQLDLGMRAQMREMLAGRRVRAGNPKSQGPRSKEIPSSKSQKEARRVVSFGYWDLRFAWDLGFGIWNFRGS
jgi:NAD(P)-dependent dehydrogenase (short-subunit alcohol dehydrogenase family)